MYKSHLFRFPVSLFSHSIHFLISFVIFFSSTTLRFKYFLLHNNNIKQKEKREKIEKRGDIYMTKTNESREKHFFHGTMMEEERMRGEIVRGRMENR